MEFVVIRKLEHLAGTAEVPRLGAAVEIRDRPGPVFKNGAFEDDDVWIQLHGGLFVAKARLGLSWVGEFGSIGEVRARTRGTPLHDIEDFWKGRPRYGYAAVGPLKAEAWVPPFWAGPRTYGYEWVRLEDGKKRASWLDRRDAPRDGPDLMAGFERWKASRPR